MRFHGKSFLARAVLVLAAVVALFLALHRLTAAPKRFQKTALVAVPWGAEPGRFGLFYPPDGETVGPRTFTVADNGAIFVFDTVKRNIKMFAADGRFLRSIGKDLSGYAIEWHGGFLFLLDGDTLRRYDEDGQPAGVYPVSPAIRLHEGYGQWLRVTGDGGLYVKSGRKSYRIFSDMSKGPLSDDLQAGSERVGTPNHEGSRWYRLVRRSDSVRHLQIQDARGKVLKEVPLQTGGRFGPNYFLGEDVRGNVYLEIQQIDEENRIRTGIWVLNRKGERVAEVALPDRYHTIVFRKFLVDRQGGIYHLRTEPDGVHIDKWAFTSAR